MLPSLSKKQKTDFLNSVSIASPCEANWNEMEGNEQIRFCQSCKKNVYNISSMSTDDAVNFLLEKNKERPCLKLYQRADGTLITDNCPVGLRKARTHLCKATATILFAIGLSVLAQKVQAQGLVGQPVDPRYGAYNEVGGFPDYGYDAARDCVRLLGLASFPMTAFFGMFNVRKAKKKAILWFRRGASRRIAKMLVRRKALQMLLLTLLIPPLLHFIGALIVNSLSN